MVAVKGTGGWGLGTRRNFFSPYPRSQAAMTKNASTIGEALRLALSIPWPQPRNEKIAIAILNDS